MGLFRQIIDTLPTVTGVTLGSTQRITIPRDFPREGFIIKISPTVSGAAATLAPENIFSLIKRVRLTANDGGQQRVLIDADGLSLMLRHLQWNQNMDVQTSTAITSGFGTGTRPFRLPFFFAPGVLNVPTRDLFLQNFPRFNNDPVLEITFGSQADVDTNATPTFAISACTIIVQDLKREVSIPKWRFLNTEFIQQEQTFPATVTNFRYQIPVPGFHFGIGLRPYTSATAIADNTSDLIRFQVLNVIERNVNYVDLQALNDYAANACVDGTANASTIGAKAAFIDFLTDQTGSAVINLDTLLNTNPFTQLGTGPELRLSVTGGAGVKTVFTHERVFGDISGALAVPALANLYK